MKKQSVARILVRQLAARVGLEASLGVPAAPFALPEKRDLAQHRDPEPEEEAPRAQGPGKPASAPAAPERKQPPASSQAAASAPRVTTFSSLGADLPPLAPGAHAAENEAALAPLREEALACTRCGLCKGRTHVVFGEGDPDTDLVFVGEAPGRDEDLSGHPFVGAAGKLLTAMIEKGMQRPRASVYICNILKCRPPRNRDPQPDEVIACTPYLHRQLEIIRPKLVVALGRIAAQILSGERMSMKRLRGNIFRYRGLPLLPIYHPAYLLRARRSSGGKTEADRETWEDLQKAMAHLAAEEKPM